MTLWPSLYAQEACTGRRTAALGGDPLKRVTTNPITFPKVLARRLSGALPLGRLRADEATGTPCRSRAADRAPVPAVCG